MDRSVRKILSLPLFGDDFCQWLVDLRMAQFEKLCAVSDGTIDECVQAFVNLVPALEAQYSPAQQKTEEELARWVPINRDTLCSRSEHGQDRNRRSGG